MQKRVAVHLFRMFEDYSKQYIDFSITPDFTIPENFYLSKKDIYEILKENSVLINSIYSRDEGIINKILFKELFNIDIFEKAQIDEMKNNSVKLTPLPLQARYVLYAWNQLRIANLNEITALIQTFEKKAFSGSFYTKITQMALSMQSPYFFKIARECYNTLETPSTYTLYYSILSYHFRLEGNNEYREICNKLCDDLKNNRDINENQVTIINNYLNKE